MTSARIHIDPGRKIGQLDERIYSSFTEHMGRCIYGGVYEEGSSLSDERGFRKDTLQAMKELKPPVVRYPGGNFVSNYHWQDGIGPKHLRPKRLELAWLSTESNQFGTDEFMQWCEALETEPYICLNMGTGTIEEAMNWVEYLVGKGDTYYANLRRANGRDAPYPVKLIGLGNEMWGHWQVGQLSAEEYARKARRWGKAIKIIDPTIQLVSCGKEGNDEWDWIVIRELCDIIDFHSIHLYSKSTLYEPFYLPDPSSNVRHAVGVFSPLAAETAIKIVDSLIELACIQNKVTKRPKIAFDEWNVWDPVEAPGEDGAEMKYTMTDALAVSTFLNVFIRQSQKVTMANIAQAVNVISPIMTNKNGLFRQTTFYVLKLYREFLTGTVLDVGVESPLYDGPTYPSWLSRHAELPFVDSVACIQETSAGKKRLCVSVVNRHDKEPMSVRLDLDAWMRSEKKTKAERYVLTGKPEAFNSFDGEQVTPRKEVVEVQSGAEVRVTPATLLVYIIESE